MTEREDIYYEVKIWETICYNSHYNAYVISPTAQYQIIHHDKLVSYIPLHARNVIVLTQNFERGVVLKHHISTL